MPGIAVVGNVSGPSLKALKARGCKDFAPTDPGAGAATMKCPRRNVLRFYLRSELVQLEWVLSNPTIRVTAVPTAPDYMCNIILAQLHDILWLVALEEECTMITKEQYNMWDTVSRPARERGKNERGVSA